jgi:hypothetical protein
MGNIITFNMALVCHWKGRKGNEGDSKVVNSIFCLLNCLIWLLATDTTECLHFLIMDKRDGSLHVAVYYITSVEPI